MKIVNVEDGKKKVYVQLNDIMMMQFGSPIPAEVMEKCFMDVFIVTDENRYEFEEFTEPSTVAFFEKCDWIPDYKEYRDLTEEQILACGQEIGQEMMNIASKWNNMTPEEREANEELYTRYESLEFKIHSLAEILWTKQGHRIMPFSQVPDYDGFRVKNDNCDYIAQQGLNPLQVLIFRNDGMAIDEKKEVIPQGLVQAAESILVDKNLENNEFFGDFERTRVLSDDKKYLVTTFKIIVPKEKSNADEEVLQETDQQVTNSTPVAPEKMTLAKRIRNWIYRKRSN